MKTLSNTEAELKKIVAYKKGVYSSGRWVQINPDELFWSSFIYVPIFCTHKGMSFVRNH